MATTDFPYLDVLDGLTDETQRILLALWDDLGSYGPDAAERFYLAARPVLEAASIAAQDTTAGYLATIGADGGLLTSDPLIAADAAARAYDPFDRLARNLGNGMTFEDALAGARSVVNTLGSDAVFRSTRDTTAAMAVGTGLRDWQRTLRGGCCQWCMKLSTVIFDDAASATFGHANCRCVPLPVDAAASHNASIRRNEGFDADAERLYRRREAERRLRRSSANARRRGAQAQAELATETDPDRRRRLEQRIGDWQVRAEAADKRLGLLAAV